MNDIRDFLSWFEGFQENIKKQPTAAQWAKVVERIRKIQPPPVAPPAPPRLAAAGPDPNKPPRPAMSGGVAMSAGP